MSDLQILNVGLQFYKTFLRDDASEVVMNELAVQLRPVKLRMREQLLIQQPTHAAHIQAGHDVGIEIVAVQTLADAAFHVGL